MLLSMTGYGFGSEALEAGHIEVELRSVNHRHFDVRTRLPSIFAAHGPELERLVRSQLLRGRVELTARLEGTAQNIPHLDVDRARSAFRELSALRDELQPQEPVPLTLLACIPDLFQRGRGPDSKQLGEPLQRATTKACQALVDMRRKEGEALHHELVALLERVGKGVWQIAALAPQTLATAQDKLQARVNQVIARTEAKAKLDDRRLEQEIALLADRLDVTEEITRLDSHISQARELLKAPQGSVGPRIGFLLQEMNRETNTIGSKSADIRVSRVVIELKSELERMREQVQNVL